MASSHRGNVDNEDDSDNDARITLSLSCLDTDVSDNNLDNLSDYSPRRSRRSIYSPREPRWPPREATRRSTRETTSCATRSITRQSPPPRHRSRNTYPPAHRSRRNRSPNQTPPSSDQHVSSAINLIRGARARTQDTDERVGEVLKNHYETFRIAKYKTKSGTYCSNVIFSPRLVPSNFHENLFPAQTEFVTRQQTVFIANRGIPQNHEKNLNNYPPSVHISVSNYKICDTSPRGSR